MPTTTKICQPSCAFHTYAHQSANDGEQWRIYAQAMAWGPALFGTPHNSFLWRLILNLKFAKLRRGTTSQFTLKRAKMQTSRLLSLQ